jgi:hypothetical protein
MSQTTKQIVTKQTFIPQHGDAQRLMWRLSIPASVSITGKQVRRWFDSKAKALAELTG